MYGEKSKGNVVPVLAMKVNGGVKGQLRSFLTFWIRNFTFKF